MKAGGVSRCLYKDVAEYAAPGWGWAEDEPHNVHFLCDPAMQELCSALPGRSWLMITSTCFQNAPAFKHLFFSCRLC